MLQFHLQNINSQACCAFPYRMMTCSDSLTQLAFSNASGSCSQGYSWVIMDSISHHPLSIISITSVTSSGKYPPEPISACWEKLMVKWLLSYHCIPKTETYRSHLRFFLILHDLKPGS